MSGSYGASVVVDASRLGARGGRLTRVGVGRSSSSSSSSSRRAASSRCLRIKRTRVEVAQIEAVELRAQLPGHLGARVVGHLAQLAQDPRRVGGVPRQLLRARARAARSRRARAARPYRCRTRLALRRCQRDRGSGARAPPRFTVRVTVSPGRWLRMATISSALSATVLAVEGDDHVAGLQAGLLGRAVRDQRRRAVRAGSVAMRAPGPSYAAVEAGADDRELGLALVDQLLDGAAGLVDRDREARRRCCRSRRRVWAPRVAMAELTPMTSPSRSTSGPPELPGLIAASVWIALM